MPGLKRVMRKDGELIDEILEYWFSDEVQPLWFNATTEFDDQLRDKYQSVWGLARAGTYDHWELEANGALALVIVLDQFPLNMFRLDARQYSTEAHARAVADRAIARGFDQQLGNPQKAFLYLPFMHSETLSDQDRSVELYSRAGLENNLRYAKHHRDVIRRFGRFPHRNAALSRESTPDELDYLEKANW